MGHFLSSNNPLRNSTNNKIPFFPFIFHKDFFGLILILSLYFFQTTWGVSSLSHPDNALEACALLTPLHIVPEWYFLCQYAMLKAVPNKNAGFIILLTSILLLFIFGEIRNLTTLVLLNNNGFLLSFFFYSCLCFLWIGAHFPQEKFLSYGCILTLYYYFLLMCILFSITSIFLEFSIGINNESRILFLKLSRLLGTQLLILLFGVPVTLSMALSPAGLFLSSISQQLVQLGRVKNF